MKIYNLTDIETPKLREYGHLNHTLAVGSELLLPGQSVDVPDEVAKRLEKGLEHLVNVGALALGELPAAYRLAKEKRAQADRPQAEAGGAPAPSTPEARAPAGTPKEAPVTPASHPRTAAGPATDELHGGRPGDPAQDPQNALRRPTR